MNLYRIPLYVLYMSGMFGALRAEGPIAVVGEQDCVVARTVNFVGKALETVCTKVLTISSKPALAVGMCIEECGTLAHKYLVRNALEHPCVTGAVTIGAFILFLHATETGRKLNARIESFFGCGSDECTGCDDDQCQAEETEEVVLIEQSSFTADMHQKHYRF
jgi:hypothetical protein